MASQRKEKNLRDAQRRFERELERKDKAKANDKQTDGKDKRSGVE